MVCVVGRIGTDKSSLLLGMLNELETKGNITFGGSVSYVPQTPYVQSGTVEANIVFGSDTQKVDREKLNAVIEACALTPDVRMWEHRIK